MSIKEIITDDEIAAHHYGEFGDMTPRTVVDLGVLKAMLGYRSGITVRTILARHGLIQPVSQRLTSKGQLYARALAGDLNTFISWIERVRSDDTAK